MSADQPLGRGDLIRKRLLTSNWLWVLVGGLTWVIFVGDLTTPAGWVLWVGYFALLPPVMSRRAPAWLVGWAGLWSVLMSIVPIVTRDGGPNSVAVVNIVLGLATLWGIVVMVLNRWKVDTRLVNAVNYIDALFAGATVGLGQADVTTRRLLRANPEFCRMIGYSEAELQRMTVDELNHPDDNEQDAQLFRQMIQGSLPFYLIEKRYLHKNGGTVWARVGVGVLRDEQGHPVHAWATVEDITARKLAELRLQQNEERLRLALAASQAGIWTWYPQTNAVDWDEQFSRLIGYPAGEPKSFERAVALVNPDDLPTVNAWVTKVLESTSGEMGALEYRVQSPTGETRWIYGLGNATRDSTGRVVHMTGLVLDTTARKLAELRFQQNEERLRLALEASQAGIWTWYPPTNAVDWDEQFNTLFSYPSGEPKSFERAYQLINPDDLPAVNAWITNVQESTSGDIGDLEYRVQTATGETRWIYCQGKATRDSAGRIVHLTGLVLDNTARKRSEEELRRLNESLELRVAEKTREVQLLGQAVASTHEGVLIHEQPPAGSSSRIVFVNDALCRMVGYNRQELLGNSCRILVGEGSHRDEAVRMEEELAAGRACRAEMATRRKDGSFLETEVFCTPLSLGTDTPRHVVSIFHDISERRQAERLLRDGRARLRAILDTVPSAVITIENDGTIVDCNPAAQHMFGCTAAELVGANVRQIMPAPFRYERDLTRYAEIHQLQQFDGDRELQGLRKGGETFPIELQVSRIEGLNLLTAVIVDISERRRLQQQVLEIGAQEQRRIGQELHDGTMQELTGLGLMASSIAATLKEMQPRNIDGRDLRVIDESRYEGLMATQLRLTQRLAETGRHVHQLTRGVMPVQLDSEGLRSALEELAATVSSDGKTRCEFVCQTQISIRSNTTATHLYRIAQEALHNAIKHGLAARIVISLEQLEDKVILRIADNGIGIEASQHRQMGPSPMSSGLGMKTMEYRAESIRGVLHIERGIGQGTAVVCTVLQPAEDVED